MNGWAVTVPAYATLVAVAVAHAAPAAARHARRWATEWRADRQEDAARWAESDPAVQALLAESRAATAREQATREARAEANAVAARALKPVGTPVDLLNHRGTRC